jgi:hypothetical protein
MYIQEDVRSLFMYVTGSRFLNHGPMKEQWVYACLGPISCLFLTLRSTNIISTSTSKYVHFVITIIIVVFQGLGLLACSGSEFIFWNVWICCTAGRTFWTGDQPDARPLPTQDNATQKNADTHPCLEWDSNSRSQCSSGRRQYVPQTFIYKIEWKRYMK